MDAAARHPPGVGPARFSGRGLTETAAEPMAGFTTTSGGPLRPRRGATAVHLYLPFPRCSALPAGFRRRPGEDAGLNEIRREGGEVGLWVRTGGDPPDIELLLRLLAEPFEELPPCLLRDIPDGPLVPTQTLLLLPLLLLLAGSAAEALRVGAVLRPIRPSESRGLPDRLRVVEVTGALGQQEEVLVRGGRSVLNALRHRIRLRPDDVAAQVPAIGSEGEGDHPRDPDEILGLAGVQLPPRP